MTAIGSEATGGSDTTLADTRHLVGRPAHMGTGFDKGGKAGSDGGLGGAGAYAGALSMGEAVGGGLSAGGGLWGGDGTLTGGGDARELMVCCGGLGMFFEGWEGTPGGGTGGSLLGDVGA